MQKRIFFVAYGGAHIQMLLPVIRALRARGQECIVLALTAAQPVMRQLGEPFIGFADLAEPGDEDAIKLGEKLAKDLPTPPIDTRETFAYLGLSYADLDRRLGKEEAAARYAKEGRYCFEPRTVLERALKRYTPDMVVVTSSPRAERAAIVAARALGIPAVCMVDFFGRHLPEAADPAYADKLLAFCDMARDFFIGKGRPPGDIIVTGNPAMDRLAETGWQEKGRAWRAARGWQDKHIVFWASQAEPPPAADLPARIDAAVLAALTRHPDWRLIVRFHPGEAPRFAEAGPNVHVSPISEALTPLLFACDACLIIHSTVGLEAALIGKPVVTVDMSVNTPLAGFSEQDISIGARRIEDIETCLMQALVRGTFHPPGLPPVGHATGAVTEAILSML